MIDAAVISLPYRQDRRDAFHDRAQAAALQWRWVEGVAEVPPVNFRGSVGAWGCARAHGRLLLAAETDLLVLEDDADLPVDFLDRFDELRTLLPPHWGVLKLGGQHTKPPLPVGNGLVVCRSVIRTHAYFVRGSFRHRVAEAALGTDAHWDGGFALLDGRGRNFAPDPMLVGVYDSPSDIEDSLPWEAFQ